MTVRQELASWNPFYRHEAQPTPTIGRPAPTNERLALPRPNQTPAVIAFLRHCGCPFAEKVFRSLRAQAEQTPWVRFIAVSHSDEAATARWVAAVGGAGAVEVVVDADRQLYGAFGLGASSFWHVLNPSSLASAFGLGRSDGIAVRPTESGNRWQTAGLFAVDGTGRIAYSHPAAAADDLGDLDAAVVSVKG